MEGGLRVEAFHSEKVILGRPASSQSTDSGGNLGQVVVELVIAGLELVVPFIMGPCAPALNEQDLLLHGRRKVKSAAAVPGR